ncbi:MAG: insulinase family protein [bacterium]|nr:insulinase family protein [bacterium]
MRRTLLMVGAMLLLATALMAQGLPQLKTEKYVLPNGLEVILHEDHSVPMVSVNVWYHVGSKNEKPGRTGFAHLFEHMMFQGSKNFDGDYFVPLDKIGADCNGSTSEDRTNYWENVPSEHLELALAMESDRMGHLLDVFTQEKLDNQRDVVKNERRQGVDNAPYGVQEDVLPLLIYPMGHPYSWSVIGSMEDLSAASADDVKDFFRKYYSPSNASLCLAGDFNSATAKQWIEKYFGTIPAGPPVERYTSWIPEITHEHRAIAEDEVELPMVIMAWHTPAYYAPGDAEADLLADILSSGMNSRLNEALVYRLQIADEVNAYQASREISSQYTIQATAKPGHTAEEIEAAIDAEMAKLLRDGITARELARAKTNWEVSFIRRLQNIGGFGGKADILNQYNVHLGSPDKLEWDVNRYRSATVEGINQFARTFLAPNKRGVLHIVPQGNLTVASTAVDRAVKPTPTAEAPFTPPTVQSAALSNGIQVLLVEDHRLPLVDLSVMIERGWTSDPQGKFGLAALTADMLDEGFKKLNALQISDTIRMLGANAGSGSGFDETHVNLNVLKRNFTPALGLVGDMLLSPTFPQNELDRLKNERLSAIEAMKSQPTQLGFSVFREKLYGANSAYGQPVSGTGTEASLAAITRADLLAFYQANYFPNITTVAITGDITLDEAKAQLEKVFGGWKQGTPAEVPAPTPNTSSAPTVYIVDRPGAQQSVIFAGYPCIPPTDPDYLPFMVFNSRLGGDFTSRINMNLREDKGFTYGSYSTLGNGLVSAPFNVVAPVQSQSTKEALVEILKELKEVISTRPLTNEELTDAKVSMVKSWAQGFQNFSGITSQLRGLALYDRPLDYWKSRVGTVNGLDDAKIKEVSTKYVRPNNLTIVIVGDKAKIEEGIKAMGIGEVSSL